MEKKSYIKFLNKSIRNISVTVGYELYLMPIYPDTLLPESLPRLYSVKPDTIKNLISNVEWSEVINDMPLDTITIYLFYTDTLDLFEWSIIRDEYKILKRYDLSLEDMQRVNWTITYP